MDIIRKLTLFAGVALSLFAYGGSAVQATEFRLTAGASHPPFVPWVGVLKNHVVPEATKRVAAGGKHSIKWTEAYAGALFNFNNALEGIGGGLADIGWMGTLWEPNKLPLHNVTFAAPFVTGDAILAAEIQDEMHRKIPALRQQLDKYNLVYLGPQAIDGYVIVTKKPLKSLADLKGLKLYAPGAVSLWLKGTGAVAVNGGLPVYYHGIETGLTDGAIVPGTGILPFKLNEVAPYVTVVDLGGCICGALVMNKSTWGKLPQEIKNTFSELGREYGKQVAAAIMANRKKHFAVLANKGAKFTTMSAADQKKWAALMPDIAGDWAKLLEAKGLPAKSIIRAYINGARERGEKPLRDWSKKL